MIWVLLLICSSIGFSGFGCSRWIETLFQTPRNACGLGFLSHGRQPGLSNAICTTKNKMLDRLPSELHSTLFLIMFICFSCLSWSDQVCHNLVGSDWGIKNSVGSKFPHHTRADWELQGQHDCHIYFWVTISSIISPWLICYNFVWRAPCLMSGSL